MIIAQSIVHAPDFWGTTLQMAMIADSVSHTASVITLNVMLNCYEITSHMGVNIEFHDICTE